MDPINSTYPMLTPYQFASNSPVSGIDLDGLEYYFAPNGNFIGQGGNPKNNEIRIADKYENNGGNTVITWSKTLADVKFNENNVKLLVGIAHYAASQLNFNLSKLYHGDISIVDLQENKENHWPDAVGIYNYPNESTPQIDAMMSTDKDNSSISIVLGNGKVSNFNNNIKNFESNFFHETRHLIHDKGDFGHLQVYIDQIKDKSFKNTSQKYKTNIKYNVDVILSRLKGYESEYNPRDRKIITKAINDWQKAFDEAFKNANDGKK